MARNPTLSPNFPTKKKRLVIIKCTHIVLKFYMIEHHVLLITKCFWEFHKNTGYEEGEFVSSIFN